MQGGRPGDGVVPDFPELGSAVPVNLYKPLEHAAPNITAQFRHLQNQAVALPELPPLGSWVKLKNVNASVVEGQLQVSTPLFTPLCPPHTASALYTSNRGEVMVVPAEKALSQYPHSILPPGPFRQMRVRVLPQPYSAFLFCVWQLGLLQHSRQPLHRNHSISTRWESRAWPKSCSFRRKSPMGFL